MSCKGLTQSLNTLVQLQLVITSKDSNSLDPFRSAVNVGPDLGPNCLKGYQYMTMSGLSLTQN